MSEPITISAPTTLFKPSEIIGILRNHLATGQVNQKVVCLRGIYFKGTYINQYFHTAADRLVDESTSDELLLAMPLMLRDNLVNGNVITVQGVLDRSITNKGLIQIVLKVSDVEKTKELSISEDEIKRAEIRRIKAEKGFKNVDGILESLLYQGKRPKIALIYAETSITQEDFEKGVQAARTHIDFTEYRESFAKTKSFCEKLKQFDSMGFDVIAIIRGGGTGLEALDEVELLETLVHMETAWMYGSGHEGEKLFIMSIADKSIAIPHALGTYFRDITDRVIQKRNNSRAALVKEVEGQFKKQIDDSNKKNQELTKQLEVLQKQNKEQTDASNKKIDELTSAQKEYEKVVKEMTEQYKKEIDNANKLHIAQNETLHKANCQLQEQLKSQGKTLSDLQGQTQRQQVEFNKSLDQMQNANKMLQESATQMTSDLIKARQRITELERKKTRDIGYIIVIIVLVLISIIGIIL